MRMCKVLILVVVLGIAPPFGLLAQTADEQDPAQRFSASNPASTIIFDHAPWDTFLKGTVFAVGKSRSRLGRAKLNSYVESHITYGNSSPSRYEGNRLLFHMLDDDLEKFLTIYQANLQALTHQIPLSRLNKDEQLAFWLNLYNATVIKMLVDEYPVSKLKPFRFGSSRQTAFWQQKVLNIEGVPLSLLDVERILIANWQDPMIIYGLFQGSIGGPSLSNTAYSHANVHQLLKKYGDEFVNSNRGYRVRDDVAQVSQFYEWMFDAFETEDAVFAHIRSLATAPMNKGLEGATGIKFKLYDWYIADLLEGRFHSGRDSSFAALVGNVDQEFIDYFRDNDFLKRLPPQAINFIMGVLENNDVPGRTPVVTVEPCPAEGDCIPDLQQ